MYNGMDMIKYIMGHIWDRILVSHPNWFWKIIITLKATQSLFLNENFTTWYVYMLHFKKRVINMKH